MESQLFWFINLEASSSHSQHSQDAPAHLQPLVLCGHAWDFQCFLHEMLLHPLQVGTCSTRSYHWNESEVSKGSSIPGWLLPTPPWWQCSAALHAATVLICSAPIPLWSWGPALHLRAALIFVCVTGLGFWVRKWREVIPLKVFIISSRWHK